MSSTEPDGDITPALGAALAAPSRPLVVCLCGSLRFHDLLAGFRARLTLDGTIVLGPESVGYRATQPEVRSLLDGLHRARIDLADSVLVVTDNGGYYGEHTRGEIRYAVKQGKTVEFVSPAARQRALDEGILP